MKLISLNTWSGRAGKEGLLDFFRSHADIDIFCLQEVWEGGEDEALRWGGAIDTAMVSNIGSILGDHVPFFRPHYHEYYGLAAFIRKDLSLLEEGDVFVFKERENAFDTFDKHHARNIQYMTIATPRGKRTIINFHGIWNGMHKEDCEERIAQSERITSFLKGIDHEYVLTGDFNLVPATRSLEMLEESGMRNLIRDYNITSTRSRYYEKPVRFADYTLVSNGIHVIEFKILPDEVSDHLAMHVEFE